MVPGTAWHADVVRTFLSVVLLVSAPAHAKPFGFAGAHASYAIGGSTANDGEVRHAIDLGITGGWFDVTGSRDGLLDTKRGTVFSGAIVTGMGAYPTYAGAELGIAGSGGVAAASASLGAFARVHPDVTGGLGLHLTADLVAFQLGARVMVLGLDTEMVAMVTFGFGRF